MSKRKPLLTNLILASLSIGILIYPTNSANAFFGIGDCKNLKNRVIKQDAVGRVYWDKYQNELGNFARLNSGYSASELMRKNRQIQVIARLMLQVFNSDKKIFDDMLKYPKCLKNLSEVKEAAKITNSSISFFRGEKPDNNGIYIKNYNDYNLNYYSEYTDAVNYLK